MRLYFLLLLLNFSLGLGNNLIKRWQRNLLLSPINTQDLELPPAQWFEQTLDHFHPTDDRSWKQRYFINDTFYEEGGPVFLMIGGEGPANPIWMVTGSWIDYAKEHKAICFQLEHRFYGESHPTEDMSVKNLLYLTSTQALADLATFISAMNDAHNLSQAKWIAFGGSYPGSLAAWLRLKYPHLVHGSVSTSGPLIAQADFPEYLEVVDQTIEIISPECNKLVKKGMSQAARLTLHRVGWKLMGDLFKTCTPFDGIDSRNVSNIMESIIGNFEDIIQYNKDNRGFEGVTTSNITITKLCSIMTDGKGTPIEKLAKVNSFMLEATGQKCLDYSYDQMIQEMSSTNWKSSAGAGGRQWTYQTCTEFGWYQSSDQPGHPFSNLFNVTFSEKQCQDIFGPKFNLELLERGIKRSNTMYGAKNIQVSNVVFVHGSFDPWHALGITEDNGANTAILIPGTAHCANMYPASQNDPPQLKQARQTVGKLIAKWLD